MKHRNILFLMGRALVLHGLSLLLASRSYSTFLWLPLTSIRSELFGRPIT